jgi:hypothetical protein
MYKRKMRLYINENGLLSCQTVEDWEYRLRTKYAI